MLRYLGKVDILGHSKGVDVHAKQMKFGLSSTLAMFALQKGTVT